MVELKLGEIVQKNKAKYILYTETSKTKGLDFRSPLINMYKIVLGKHDIGKTLMVAPSSGIVRVE